MESDDNTEAAKARLLEELHVGDVAALVRSEVRRVSCARFRGRATGAVWVTALAGLVDIGYVKATGESVKINLPKTANFGEVELEWRIPKWSSTLERNRARSYFQAYAAGAALYFLERALADVHAGDTKV